METFIKKNQFEIEATKVAPIVEPTKTIINFEQKEFYQKQILDITKQRDGQIAELQTLKTNEIAECQARIKAITDNAIIAKTVEVIKEVLPVEKISN